MNIAIPIVALIALGSAIVCMALALFHAIGMIRGIRASSEWWVSLMPLFAFAFPAALDAAGQVHRAKFLRWVFLAAGLATLAGLLLHVYVPA